MAAKDITIADPQQADDPYIFGAAVVPNDGTDMTFVTRGLYVGVTGDVAVTMKGGGNITFKAVPAGTVLRIRVSRVLAAGSTATNLVALW